MARTNPENNNIVQEQGVITTTTTTIKFLLSAESLRPRVKKAALSASTWCNFDTMQKSNTFVECQQIYIVRVRIMNCVYEDMNTPDATHQCDSFSHRKYT